MRWKRAAAAVGVVLGTLALAQGGCEPQLNVPVQQPTDTPEIVPTLATDDTSATAVATDVPPQAAPAIASPSPGLSRSPVAAAASPSTLPKPSPAAAQKSPSPTAPVALIAVSMAKDNRVAEIDPLTGKMIRVVDLSEPAGKMAMTPDGHSVWVFKPQGAGATVAILDLTSGDRREDIQFHEGDSPVAAAFAADGSRAYVAIGGSVVYAAGNGKEFGRVVLGRQTADVQVPRRVTSLAVSGSSLYAADQASGVVWVLDAGSGATLNQLDIGGGPLRMVSDPARQREYVLVDTLNQVVAIDTTSQRITNRLNLPGPPAAATVGPDGTLYVAGGDTAGELWVISRDATDVRASVPIGGRPVAVTMAADGSALYVPDAAGNSLNIVSADTIQVLRTIPLASQPEDVIATSGVATAVPQDAAAAPAAPPALVASATPLPEGALPPDKLPTGAMAEPFVSGAAVPNALVFAPDGRLFYAEQRTGKIRIVQDGALLADPFYQLLVSDQPDTGLVALTLDPDYQHNHYMYVLYTAPKTAGGASGLNELIRLTDVDNKGTDLRPVLQDLPAIGTQSSGSIRFGADGKLYVSLRDDDKGTNAQDLSTLAGKILRVNPDGSPPADNPFVGQPGKQEAIWAYGLHDASSFAFHPLGHQLVAVDSAQGERDALALILRGANYGWPAAGDKAGAAATPPLAVIKPSIRPTGSTFYVADQLPDWTNDWFYCDAVLKQLRRVRLAAQSFDRIVFEEVVKQGCTYDVATGPDGALYYSDAQGIYRIRMSNANVLQAPKTAGPRLPVAP
jgi:glucose/arabinose dehydrogenase/outer membrane protein assembly factor BamB